MPSDDEICPSVWYGRAKVFMFVLWSAFCGLDTYIWWTNKAPPWSILVLVLTNGWGWLDAVVRYPIIHDIDSLFTLKNLLLILLKILWLILIFMRNKENPVMFVVGSMLAIVVPMFYAMFLPLDETEKAYNLIKSAYSDDDIGLRLWIFLRDPRAGVLALNRMRYRAVKRGLEELAERSPAAAAKLGESGGFLMSASGKAALRKPGRSV
ncbi:unnamed protein product [Polarella glacialis]|uniref:Uncharacterized protein n=1 Tax=Polarella glacialis TaxID=89957 RepID=A0A813EWN2_POLGL|nr:unnamed protein product [Polarella glacialis]